MEYSTPQKHLKGAFVFWFYFATQRLCSFACAKELFGEAFLDGDCASNRFLRTRKGTLTSAFCVTGAICYANNQSLLCAQFTLSNPLVRLPRKQPIFTHQKRHSDECLLCYWCYLLRKQSIVALRTIYFVKPSCTATAQATLAPTIGLLPIPIKPIISTCAGTDEEPANCASECILPIVSVIP